MAGLPRARGRVLARFPSLLVGQNGIRATLNGGVWNIETDFAGLTEQIPSSGAGYHALVLDTDGILRIVELPNLPAKATAWEDVTGKPLAFPPAAHEHQASAITDFSEAVDDRVAALLQAGSNITLAYDDATNTLVISSAAAAQMPAGAIVNSKYAEYTANADLPTPIPWDDTLPQGTEGTQVLSITHAAASATNKIRLRFRAWGTANAPTSAAMIAALVLDSSASASAATMATAEAAGNLRALCLEHELTPGDTVAHTYNIRVGSGTGTMRLNGSTSSRWLGGASRATLILEEIKA